MFEQILDIVTHNEVTGRKRKRSIEPSRVFLTLSVQPHILKILNAYNQNSKEDDLQLFSEPVIDIVTNNKVTRRIRNRSIEPPRVVLNAID